MNHELFLIHSSYLTSKILPSFVSKPEIHPDCKHLEKQYITSSSKPDFDALVECIQQNNSNLNKEINDKT